jgi:hypothetical protein
MASVGRAVLLALLAGHLLFRQEFAHRTLFELVRFLGLGEYAALSHAYVTEVFLALLLPLAVLVLVAQIKEGVLPRQVRLPMFFALAFLLLGASHVVAAFVAAREPYLIFRQGAFAGYTLIFLYTAIFFRAEAGKMSAVPEGTDTNLRSKLAVCPGTLLAGRMPAVPEVKLAALVALAAAILCAALDALVGIFGPSPDSSGHAGRTVLEFLAQQPFGQETLAIAILGLGLFIISSGGAVGCSAKKRWTLRGLALLALALSCWRQGLRLQSSVPMALAGTLLCYLLLGAGLALRGQRATLKRALLLVGFFAVLGGAGWVALQAVGGAQKAAPEGAEKIKGWSYKAYADLFDIYNGAAQPADLKGWLVSARDHVPVNDPEAYKLEAVFQATAAAAGTRDNIWRLLLWRRMWNDWLAGKTWLGAGVGRPWFYSAMYHTHFHYGEKDLGLDPHNSYLNLLYRYGVIGFLLFAALVLSVMVCVWRVLSRGGNGLLEGLVIYFFYTLFFAFFVVALEGPSYAIPFWMALGCLNAECGMQNAE